MPNAGQTLVRFVGAIFLGAAAVLIDRPRPTRPSAPIATVPVVVSARAIPEGVVIDRSAVIVAMRPATALHSGAYVSVDSVIGRVARTRVAKGEAITLDHLITHFSRNTLEVRVTPGKRAYGVRVSDESSSAGLVRPNSRVDVFVLLNDSTTGEREAYIVLANVRVLAIGQTVHRNAHGDRHPFTVATLEISPEDVDLLAPAAAEGDFHLIVRAADDMSPVSTARIRAGSARLLAR